MPSLNPIADTSGSVRDLPLNRRRSVSVVTPCFNEELNVTDCYMTVRELFGGDLPDYDYEHIFCDNASTDRTLEILEDLAAADPNVKIIANARNFGPFNSLMNGIAATSGDAVVLFLAADLQDPPEIIPQMVRLWEQGYDVVYGVRKQREEGLLMRAVRNAYYRLVRTISDLDLLPGVGEFQLVDRQVVGALRQFDDYYPYIRGMVAYCGFRSTGIEYTWKARKRGFTKNSLLRLIDQGLNGAISFSKVPMRLCMTAGFLTAGLSLGYAAFALVFNLLYLRQLAPPGIPTLIVALFFFGGIQLFFLGVVGEYIAAIHAQVRKRPLVVERKRINFSTEPPDMASMITARPERQFADCGIGAEHQS